MTNKTCLVTGASAGIGFETALALAGMDATVIMVSSRNQKLQFVMKEVARRSNSRHLVAIPCDLSCLASVRKLAGEVLSNFDGLDVLVNNAGVFRSKKTLTCEGLEFTNTVNHLAPFLLTALLLPGILGSAPSRVINLVSSFHQMGRIDPDDLQFTRKRYNGLAAYNNSKLANIMFTYELARKLNGTGVTVNASDPWGTRTCICQGQKGFYSLLWGIQWPFLQSGRKGAENSVYLACSEEVKNISGRYFRHKKELKSSGASYNTFVSEKLWSECERLTGVSYDEIIGHYKASAHSNITV